jgi:uncharacterized protein
MSLLAVLDVNTLASAAASGAGLPGQVVDLATDGLIRVAVSEQMLVKLGDVLRRPYFWKRLSEQEREDFIASFRAVAHKEDPDPDVVGVADDEEDDLVLGTAVAAGADYLVTGDTGLLDIGEYRGVKIVTAREFLILIDAD